MTCSYVYTYVLHSSRLLILMYVCHGSAIPAAVCIYIHILKYVYIYTATHCNTLQHTRIPWGSGWIIWHCNIYVTYSQTTSSWVCLHNLARSAWFIFFFQYVIWLVDLTDSLHLYFGGNSSCNLAGSDSLICVNMRHMTCRLFSSGWLLSNNLAGRDSCIQMTRLIYIWDKTRSNIRQDCIERNFGGKWYRCTFFVTKNGCSLPKKERKTNVYKWHASFIFVTWLVHMWDITHWLPSGAWVREPLEKILFGGKQVIHAYNITDKADKYLPATESV